MPAVSLQKVEGINQGGAELLAAVGVEGVSSLSRSEPSDLLEEMEMANRHLALVDDLPSLGDLQVWIEEARQIEEKERPDERVTRLEEAVELVPVEVVDAVPITKEFILEHEISVHEVPVMDEFCSKEDLLEERVVSLQSKDPDSLQVAVREIGSRIPARAENSENAEAGERRERRGKVEPLERAAGIDLRKTASPGLNAGRKAHSRKYIRGVLHPQPARVKFGALLSVITMTLMPLSFVSGIMILTVFQDRVRENLWVLAIPVAFLVFGLLYAMLARPVKCRVCGQPIFSPKACRRNPKAHHVLILGYIFPTSLHLLFFHWFRCIYCGTSVRLKK